MSHNLSMVEGKARMMYVGDEPWHKLGTKLDNPATAAEAIAAANLDYQVELVEMQTVTGLPIVGRKATVTEGKVLGVVSDQYRVIQNRDAFGFFDSAIGEGRAVYETAGALGDGERIWIMAHLPETIRIKGDDIVERNLVLTNSHNGQSALRMYFTPIRVVCQNTLMLSLQKMEQSISIRHIGDTKTKIEIAREALGLADKFFGEFSEAAKAMTEEQLTVSQLDAFVETLFPKPEDGRSSTKRDNAVAMVEHLFVEGRGNGDGSLWSAYNAVTEYADYHLTVQGVQKDPSKKVKSVLFGGAAALKMKAWNSAMALIA